LFTKEIDSNEGSSKDITMESIDSDSSVKSKTFNLESIFSSNIDNTENKNKKKSNKKVTINNKGNIYYLKTKSNLIYVIFSKLFIAEDFSTTIQYDPTTKDTFKDDVNLIEKSSKNDDL